MRKFLTFAAVLAAMAGFGGFANAAVASANSCSGVSVGDWAMSSQDIVALSRSGATCAGRWTAETYYQYEDGGHWSLPSNVGAANAGGQANCPSTNAGHFWDRWCYGTAGNNGIFPGFTGAGNSLTFKGEDLTSITMSGSHGSSACNYNWRQLAVLYDYASGSTIQTNSREHAAGTLC